MILLKVKVIKFFRAQLSFWQNSTISLNISHEPQIPFQMIAFLYYALWLFSSFAFEIVFPLKIFIFIFIAPFCLFLADNNNLHLINNLRRRAFSNVILNGKVISQLVFAFGFSSPQPILNISVLAEFKSTSA